MKSTKWTKLFAHLARTARRSPEGMSSPQRSAISTGAIEELEPRRLLAVVTGGNAPGSTVSFLASTGEVNNVTFTNNGVQLLITDPGNLAPTLIPIANVGRIQVFLGDQNDRVTLAGLTAAFNGVPALLNGGEGNDLLIGGPGPNTYQSGPGDDTMVGGAGANVYQFANEVGNDQIQSTPGGVGDVIDFSAVDLPLLAKLGRTQFSIGNTTARSGVTVTGDLRRFSQLIGGSGNDTFVFIDDGASVNGTVNGGGGINLLSYAGYSSQSPVRVDLNTGSATGTLGIVGFRNVSAGAGNDHLVGDNNDNTLIGGAGDDTLEGGFGRNTYVVPNQFGQYKIIDIAKQGTLDLRQIGQQLTLAYGPELSQVPPGSQSSGFFDTEEIRTILLGNGANTVVFPDPAKEITQIGLQGGIGTTTLDYSRSTLPVTVDAPNRRATSTSFINNITNVIPPNGLQNNINLTPPTPVVDSLIAQSALFDYIAKPDPEYKYEVLGSTPFTGGVAYSILMTSQKWRNEAEVNQPIWQHTLTVLVPFNVSKSTALLFINGGSTPGSQNDPAVISLLSPIAVATGSVIVNLAAVPNEPLLFAGETQSRTEDQIIAYSFDKYIQTGDPEWPVLLPMTKAAVKAMDTVQSFVPTIFPGGQISNFVVSGGSKRGWTTWLTAIADTRVTGIAPAVFDVLNIADNINWQFQAYGFFSNAIAPYVDLNVFGFFDTPRGKALAQVVDPYAYVDRLRALPIFELNSSGDQFFLPDSGRFYMSTLEQRGDFWVRYFPNTGHSLVGNFGLQEPANALGLYYYSLLNNIPIPDLTWSVSADNTITAMTSDPRLIAVRLWQATNPNSRDFRIDVAGPIWTSSNVPISGSGTYTAALPAPPTGGTGYFLEFEFNSGIVINGSAINYKFTTQIAVQTNQPPLVVNYSTAPGSYGLADHNVNPGVYLGARIGAPLAPGLQVFEYDPVDGVILPNLKPGEQAVVLVNASRPGYLSAWIDFDGSGNFSDPKKKVITNQFLHIGLNPIVIDVPLDATVGTQAWARFRFSNQTNLNPTGLAADGEVEDYQFRVNA